MKRLRFRHLLALALGLGASCNAFALFKGGAVPERFGSLAVISFAVIIAITMYGKIASR
jgi:hypothetical protein